MLKKQVSLLLLVIALAGMMSACARKKQQPAAPAYSLDEARARAAAQQEPVTPARTAAPRASSSYIK